jgi:hypothetical protein
VKITRVIRVGLFVFVLVLLSSVAAHAGTVNAASCSSSDVQAAINAASSGDTVVVPSGTCTWTTAVTVSGKAVTLQGQTVCSGTPPSSCTDSTIISLSVASGQTFNIICSPTNFVTIQGFTFKYPGGNGSNGALGIGGTSWPPSGPSFRFTNSHVVMNTGNNNNSLFSGIGMAYGLIDHILFVNQDTASSSGTFGVFGDSNTKGFLSWQTPLAFGTNQAVYFEDNTFTYGGTDTEGPWDGYSGARLVFRYNTVTNSHVGGHGTDSGNDRSTFSAEIYANTFTNNAGAINAGVSRGGTYLLWGNTFNGSTGYGAFGLVYNRAPGSDFPDAGNWGLADGTQWLMGNVNINSNNVGNCFGSTNLLANCNSTGGAAWQASNSYANLTAIIPTSGNAAGSSFTAQGACTSGSSRPSTWNQTIGGTQSDGSCTWLNEGGLSAAAAVAYWCAINRDVPATSDSTCSAITPGDTASTFFDGNGAGGYPARDQPGRTHNQALAPMYEWLNSPDPGFGVSAGKSSLITANRDYYTYQTSGCSGTQTTGVCSGTLAQLPQNCSAGPGGNTPGVAYWATDTSTLYVCNPTNTWATYYSPYTYPYPLNSSAMAPTAPTNLQATIQ